jgi:hypothetical protein
METGELRYYHSSQNNSRLLDVPHLIRTEEDLEKFLNELQGQDILEYIRQQRPDTKWVVHGCRSLPLSEWTTNAVYTRLWSRGRQVEPPCRLQLGSFLDGYLLVVTRYVAALGWVLMVFWVF